MTFEIEAFADVFDETVSGDMSDDETNPSAGNLAAGGNVISGNTGPGDRDFVTFSVPAGYQLSSMVLETYSGVGIQSFSGIVNGTELGVDPGLAQESDLLGYYLMNSGAVGTDILPAMGEAFNAQGFTPPLPAGDYTMWFQELSGPDVDYELHLMIEESSDEFVPSVFIYLPVMVR